MDAGFRTEVEEILQMVGLAGHKSEILRISDKLVIDPHGGCLDLMAIDRTIPGLGIHNVNEETDRGTITGIYRIQDRAIFRGIQYVYAYLLNNDLEWMARKIVTDSCYHIESSLKRRLCVEGALSVGMILNRAPAGALDSDLTSVLWHLNKAIYNNAKHTIENISMDSHMFSIADSIAVYLACRKIGMELLKDMGITDKYGRPVFCTHYTLPEIAQPE